MCNLCDKIYTKEERIKWFADWHQDDNKYNIIFKDINYYLYISVNDRYYTPQTRMLINYCPVCGRKL